MKTATPLACERERRHSGREKASERARAGHADGSDITLRGGGSEIHGGGWVRRHRQWGETHTRKGGMRVAGGGEYMTGDTVIAVAHVCVKKNL